MLKSIYTRIVGVFLAIGLIAAVVWKFQPQEEVVWHKNRIQWTKDDSPLKVSWPHQDFIAYNDVIRASIDMINDRVGCRVLAEAAPPGDIQIKAFEGSVCHGTEAVDVSKDVAATTAYCSGYAEISTVSLDEIGLAFRIFTHEIVHGIGLDHDKDVNGIMNPRVFEPTPYDFPEYLLLSEAHIKAIKKTLCR